MARSSAETLDGNTFRVADHRRPEAVRYRTVEDVFAAVAALVEGLLTEAGFEIGDEIDLRIAYPRGGVHVEVSTRDATRSTVDPLPPLTLSAAPLTKAERNVLPYLATSLTFPLIAKQLFVSRNTVKTQAISIYRKLGVSSRNDAVQVARETGLLRRYVALPTTRTVPEHTISA